ncbi:sugar ABC transporter ATP-binding protein [Rhizobium grahamii]|uniref:Autoinducer 2 import ATP-binding protein LsrA n=1 Tax=Rhizobium grahamii TaxID=1120045 RepID=A0A5Q0C9G0_9HYPH|nr:MULTISPECIES: sugar ABC transporter ATP-binding protein [Rhizobium]QFY60481.1 sugar ABC transporter ATP-binding protein [Rhizobium grahamii]QRM50391.1 sugar ABC transporter ATP-binding protein [Rhizobium sp. BG6]
MMASVAGERPVRELMPIGDRTQPFLRIDGVRKSFGPVRVLRDISFSLQSGEVLALLGENGAGKSTLKNILSGLVTPDEGTITIAGREFSTLTPADIDNLGFGTIHQELSLFDNLSVAENIHMPHLREKGGLVDWKGLEDGARRLLHEQLGTTIDLASPAGELTLGERQMVEIAKAMRRATKLLILDEPTTCLSLPEREKLFTVTRRLRERGFAIIYITHFLEEVYALADSVVILRDGVVADAGKPGDFSRDRIAQAMVGRKVAAMEIAVPSVPKDAPIALRLEEVGDGGLVKDISLELREGEILGIAGLMGSGRTELAETICGFRKGVGRVTLGGVDFSERSPRAAIDRGLVLVSEDRRRDQAFLNHSVLANVSAANLRALAGRLIGWLDFRREKQDVERIAEEFVVQPRRLETAMVNLSGGNQQKAILGRWLSRQPKVAVLDEPTKGVDIGARAAVHQIVVDRAVDRMAFILISSDIPELLAISHRIAILHKGRLAGILPREAFDAGRILGIASTGVVG